MSEGGLRARKKARTRAHIAGTAARLFGLRGYEQVTVAEIAAEAEVSEQTVYNYFPVKQDLVLDQDAEVRERFTERIRERVAGTSPAAAVRGEALALVEAIGSIPSDQMRGTLGHLATVSPAVRRLCLESTDRLAEAIADVLADTTPGLPRALAKVQAIALAWISQTVLDEAGRRIREGEEPERIVRELRPLMEAIVDDLDRAHGAGSRPGSTARS